MSSALYKQLHSGSIDIIGLRWPEKHIMLETGQVLNTIHFKEGSNNEKSI